MYQMRFKGQNGNNNPEGVIPELKSFNGNDKTVTMNMQVSEYADDDFHAASVGGIFNVVRVSDNENTFKCDNSAEH